MMGYVRFILTPTSIAHLLSAPSKADHQLRISEEELESGVYCGAGSWLAMGMQIQETQ